jgi:hypothetical protein
MPNAHSDTLAGHAPVATRVNARRPRARSPPGRRCKAGGAVLDSPMARAPTQGGRGRSRLADGQGTGVAGAQWRAPRRRKKDCDYRESNSGRPAITPS